MREHRKDGFVRAPSVRDVVTIYLKLLQCIGSPVALKCAHLAREGQWDELVSLKVRPEDYNSVLAFQEDYLAVSVLSKASFLETKIDRREAAVTRFLEAERMCFEANTRLSLYATSKLMPTDLRVHAVLHRARELIRNTLGDDPSAAAKKYGFAPRFGPGVTSSCKGDVYPAKKYRSRLDVTPRLYSCWRDLFPGSCLERPDVSLLASNKVTFVPKNCKTHRSIAIEPTLNVYAQLGVGGLIRHLLARDGLDLTTQSEWNRFLASRGEDWRLATIDLSMASDTLCRELVWLLLPEGWADLLDRVRSPFGDLDGVEFEYEKFSSMGNGSTFELETLIFNSLALASGSRRELTATFGDDIIVEADSAELLIKTLEFCGFKTNLDKTFLTGPFRESCGEDYFLGTNVRPFFWKELEPSLFYKMANDIGRFARRRVSGYLDSRFLPAWLKATALVPPGMRVGVPAGLGDIGLVVNFDSPYAQPTWHRVERAWRFRALSFDPRTVDVSEDPGGLAAALDGYSFLQGLSPIRGRGRYRISRHILFSAFGGWRGLGTWD